MTKHTTPPRQWKGGNVVRPQLSRGPLIRAVDLFCGAGGLTNGLESAGIDVSLGIDVDPACKFPFEANNRASFLLKSVSDVSGAEIRAALKGGDLKLLAGCAPCQTFSTYSQGRDLSTDSRWTLLQQFTRLIKQARPHLVTMENVPRLEKQEIFAEFTKELKDEGFFVFHAIVNCVDYGIAQQRQRLVLLASRLGPIELVPPTTPAGKHHSVKKAIGKLPPLKAGEVNSRDPLHQASELSSLNFERIRASTPGGTWRDWNVELVAECHKKISGKTYPSVYGRMSWDEPSPTVTTQYYGFGNGRFGHPEQDRAISLREGAILQSFPRDYQFVPPGQPIYRKVVGRLIGNAVPVKLGEAIGASFMRHIQNTPRTAGKRA